jgi:hypothetical protein
MMIVSPTAARGAHVRRVRGAIDPLCVGVRWDVINVDESAERVKAARFATPCAVGWR